MIKQINRQKRLTIDLAEMQKVLDRALLSVKLPDFSPRQDEIIIYWVNNKTIRQINEEHLQHQGVTDVITFHYPREDFEFPEDDPHTYSEIFVSVELASQKFQETGCTLGHEVVLYAIHGILHLSGLDDHSPEDIRQMRAAEQDLISLLESEFKLDRLIQ